MNDAKRSPERSEASAAARRSIDLVRLGALDANVISLWSKYEDVAIHFNDLIMRWRIQAIGGLLTLLTLAGFVVGNADTFVVRYRAMLILAGTLSTAWLGVALIDLCYYRRLLSGAVDAILELEKATSDIRLSGVIEDAANSGGEWAPIVFYLSGWLPLLATVCWALHQLAEVK